MARHAGFAAVATVTQGMINATIAAYCRAEVGPFFFPLPTVIGIPPFAVTFSGLMEMRPPTVELQANPANLVRVHFTFLSTLRAQLGQQQLNAAVQLGGAVDIAIGATPQDGRIVLAIDTQQVVFQPLTVQVVAGPALPAPIINALQSPALAAIATNFVQSLPPITASPSLLSSQIDLTQPLNLPWFIAPQWFKIKLNATGIALRILNKAASVGLDLSGPVFTKNVYGLNVTTSDTISTSGDPNALVDLTSVKGSGSIYKQHFTQMTDPNVPPYLSRHPEPKGGTIAVAINTKFLSAVVEKQISPQIAQTPLSGGYDVALVWLRLGYSTFKNFDGSQDGLVVKFKVFVEEGPGANVEGSVFLQMFLREADGTTDFVWDWSDRWLLYIAKVDVELPPWVKLAALVLTITFSAAAPALAPMLVVTGMALLEQVTLIEKNAENQTKQSLQSAANRLAFPTQSLGPPLPGLPDWWWQWVLIRYVSFTSESVDLAISVSPLKDYRDEPRATMSPDAWLATDKKPIAVSLKLREDLEKLGGPDLKLSWTVWTGDTGKIAAAAVKAYNDPLGNGVLIPHHSEDLYLVDSFVVECVATLTLGSQVGEIWRGKTAIHVFDKHVDRHHRFVEWGPKYVYFRNEGTGGVWWYRTRKSRIHRTAVSARCKALREPIRGAVKYSDTLPFAWSALATNRKVLCEYCFFGGPDKSDPLPEADWF
jgi:hypothetical protein